MNWAEAGFEVLGQHVVWVDLIGNVCALGTVWLAMRKTVWAWPVQLTGAVLLFAASISAHITGNALKQVLFAALALWGWWKWSRGTRDGAALAVRPATGAERLGLVAAMAAGTALVAAVFYLFPALSWAPIPDAYIFVGSAVATFAMGRALTDFWLIWVAVDLVGVPLAFSSGLIVSGLVYGVFLIMVLIGYRKWRREHRAAVRTKGTQEAVAA